MLHRLGATIDVVSPP